MARRGISPAETVTLCILVAALAASATSVVQPSAEHGFFGKLGVAEFQQFKSYGPDHSSQFYEEWLIRDFFKDAKGGVFLDVGANHYRDHSTTYYLEKHLGWSGIAVDALEEFAADYAVHRPRTRYVAMFASDVPNQSVKFFVAKGSLVSSMSEAHTQRFGPKAPATARTVPTTTLTSVLDQAGIGKIDFLSMDIEEAEPMALAGFDIDRFQPALVCIEGHPEVRQQILDYFARHKYVLVGKYLRADPLNLYFRPRS
jgi:FkbM family methyltransferase